jgi:CarboxypepD_reg-like domain
MAKKQLTISIPTPCTEDWNNMTPDKNGKFCASCQKSVVDFTRMSDAEIFRYFDTFKGNACGRFSEKQLSAPIIEPLVLKPNNRWAWALSALLLPSVAMTQSLRTTEIMKIVSPSVSESKTSKNGLPIKGKVTELGTGLPLMNAYVSIVANEQLAGRVSTNEQGFFIIFLPQEFENQHFTLFFDCNKMEKRVLSFENYATVLSSQVFIFMEKTEQEKAIVRLGGVVTDMHNQALIGASIVVKGTTIGTVTDIEGHFELNVLAKYINNQTFEIETSYVGYGVEEFKIMPSMPNENLHIILQEGSVLGGYAGYMVHRNLFQRTKYRIRNFFRRLRGK